MNDRVIFLEPGQVKRGWERSVTRRRTTTTTTTRWETSGQSDGNSERATGHHVQPAAAERAAVTPGHHTVRCTHSRSGESLTKP